MSRVFTYAGCVIITAVAIVCADDKPSATQKPAIGASRPVVVWTSLFDGKTPKGWKNSNVGIEGGIEVTNGHMNLEMTDGISSITWQKDFPKTNYEIRLQAMRIEGGDFFCGLTFPVQKDYCSFIVGGWGGTVVGLSSIDGEDAARNDSTKYQRFETGKWYSIRVRVTEHRIQAWIDDQPMVDQPLAGKKISIRPEVGSSKPLGIASWNTTAGLKGIEYRRLSADEIKASR